MQALVCVLVARTACASVHLKKLQWCCGGGDNSYTHRFLARRCGRGVDHRSMGMNVNAASVEPPPVVQFVRAAWHSAHSNVLRANCDRIALFVLH